MNDVIIGAWRNGLDKQMAADLEITEKRHAQGFRLLGFESTVLQLAQLLDAHDELFAELLTKECDTCAAARLLDDVSIPYIPQHTEVLIPVAKAAKKK